MKIFVMVDMEGISGICQSDQVLPGNGKYEEARRYLTWDVNACIDGCFSGGADEVVVRDAHGSGHNLIWPELDPRARYIQGGSGAHRMPDLESCDGLMLLGYHAMAGTPQAILEHTMSSKSWQNFWINGKKSGEIAIDAGMAGDSGVPTIMVSGDDKACREARRFIKGVVAVEVKRGLSVQGGILLSKEVAHQRLKLGAARAVEKCGAIEPYRVKRPVALRLELVSRGQPPISNPNVKVIDGRTFEAGGRTIEDALKRMGLF